MHENYGLRFSSANNNLVYALALGEWKQQVSSVCLGDGEPAACGTWPPAPSATVSLEALLVGLMSSEQGELAGGHRPALLCRCVSVFLGKSEWAGASQTQHSFVATVSQRCRCLPPLKSKCQQMPLFWLPKRSILSPNPVSIPLTSHSAYFQSRISMERVSPPTQCLYPLVLPSAWPEIDAQ